MLKRCEIITKWNSGQQQDSVVWIFEYNIEGLVTRYTSQYYSSIWNDEITEFFYYDENEKVEKMDVSFGGGYIDFTYLFTWDQNKALMVEWDYSGDTLLFGHRKFVYEFNSGNELVKYTDYNGIENPEDENAAFLEYWTFQFENGNIVKSKEFDSDSLRELTTYTYDNKKNPLSEQPLCWIFDFDLFLSKNNILTEETYNPYFDLVTDIKNFTYEYNEYGYPAEMISKTGFYPTEYKIWKFEYLCDSI